MNIYERMGLDHVINCSGKMTKLGVSTLSDAVRSAMNEAGQSFVVMDDLMAAAGKKIANLIGAEAACVTSSAASGIAVSVATIIAGKDLNRIEHPHDIIITRNEIILQKGHAVNFGAPIASMIELGGGTPVETGYSNKTEVAHVEGAITERTAALFHVISHHAVQKGMLTLAQMIEIAERHDLPLIVDAAAEEDLSRYVKMGCDMVIYSGAKALEGPTSGFIAGKSKWVDPCVKQYVGAGRAMKIGKENIVGLVTAVEQYMNRNSDAEVIRQHEKVNQLVNAFNALDGIRSEEIQDEAGRKIFRAMVDFGSPEQAKEAVIKLQQGPLRIYVRDHQQNLGKLSFDVRCISDSDVPLIVEKMAQILAKHN
ncbi:DgaE family pyridoxal phosphate-dependent ammonia lyase [Fusibacter ferrireducens]|uniref:DgaE family pyridoxal phosphate-dependent ammonia lyase n=1 Tax=Fusibacter ferrireducens TaxID=2785058 RepID=A0ABR9ZX52_9FIRM|nr:DgaE family pyridoxal phosphate-dependent ammonia lyase [Fusibacter ferrireducens]MBF4694728.1 DgaE family pyridoxal phosphate-dependent ammonia lyase [Fusibacter ferrireducens]